jgi:D-alanyl-D-alanine carboxypeptidase
MSLMLSAAEYVSLKAPFGLDQICGTFGDIFTYLRPDQTLDPRWQAEQMITISLPFPLVLSWDHSRRVSHMTCHRLMQAIFIDCFQRIAGSGLWQQITSFGGCFSFRPQRTGTKLSTHSWGISIDLNPETNAQGSAGHMHPEIVSIFRNAGFTWGGDWFGANCDPMHFQFCSGY